MSGINGLVMPSVVRVFTENSIGSSPAPGGLVVQNNADASTSPSMGNNSVDEKQLQQAIQQMNRELSSSMNAKVSFRYDRRINQLYVQVVDRESGEVVREIPPKEFLEHKAAMSEFIGLLLDKKG